MNRRISVAIISVLAVAVLLIFTALVRHEYPDGSTENARTQYLENMGWSAALLPDKTRNIIIPANFGDVFESYNELLKTGGFDLSAYRGEEAVVYTYKLLNYPDDDNVNCTLMVSGGRIIGADICSTKLDGFMMVIQERKNLTSAE